MRQQDHEHRGKNDVGGGQHNTPNQPNKPGQQSERGNGIQSQHPGHDGTKPNQGGSGQNR
jgi:hypothetical protein